MPAAGRFRRVLKHFGMLMGGNAAGGVLAAVGLALMARGLSPAEFGTVILIHTYALLAKGVLSFQSFEAVVKFGASAISTGQPEHLRRLLRTTITMDVTAALVSTALAIALVPLAARGLGWDTATETLAMLYSTCLLLSVTATPEGLLRLYDRFDWLSWRQLVRAGVRLAGIGAAFLSDAGLWAYVLAWYLSNIAEYLFLILISLRELRRQQIALPLTSPPLGGLDQAFPGIWRFMRSVYWQSLLDLVYKHVSTLLAGLLLSTTAAGLYRIAWQVANLFAKPAMLLREAVFPDLTRLWWERDADFGRIIWKSGLVVGIPAALIVLALVLGGAPLLALVMGEEYAPAAPLLNLLAAAAMLQLFGVGLRPAAYAMGRPDVVFRTHLVTTAIYLGLFAGLAGGSGLLAPGIGALTAAVFSTAFLLFWIRRALG